MKYRKFLVDRIIVEDGNEQEIKSLVEEGFEYRGDSYCAEMIFEKTTKVKPEVNHYNDEEIQKIAEELNNLMTNPSVPIEKCDEFINDLSEQQCKEIFKSMARVWSKE